MAATTLSSKEQMFSIRAKAQKEAKGKNEKATKPKVKHVLMPLAQKSMLMLDNSVEIDIVAKLNECLEKFSVPKKNVSSKQKDTESESILEKKKLLRSQIVFGVNNVTKALEKDLLRLVLTCSTADPPILTKHLVELATTRNCVAICINNLNDTLMNKINFRSAAIGFLKPIENMANDFGDFVQFVCTVAPKLWQEGNENAESLSTPTIDSDNNIDCLPAEEIKSSSNEKGECQERNQDVNSGMCVEENKNNNSLNIVNSKQDSEPEDYSRFYVFKKDLPATPLVPDFIPFMSDSDSGEEVHIETKRPRLSKDLEEYKTVNVGKMRHNENKKKSKKKLKKKSRN